MAAPGAAALGAGTKEDLRDAVEQVYEGAQVAAVAARLHVDRRRVTELVQRLPPGLVNDAQRNSLRRAANARCGCRRRACTRSGSCERR